MNPLIDLEFLKELDQQNERIIYAKVISLTSDGKPIEAIEGRVTDGTVNIDGASVIRRSCSLTLVAEDVNINNFYWGLTTKIKLDIGLENKINQKYDDIIWFPQGIFVITEFKTDYKENSFTVSISGKDKMCLLNGDVGGCVPATTDFGQEEEGTGNFVIGEYESNLVKMPIKKIIKEMIHKYGQEPFYNIIINDLDIQGLELIEYKGDSDIYLLKNISTDIFEGVELIGETIKYDEKDNEVTLNSVVYGNSSELINQDTNPTIIKNSLDDKMQYIVYKAQYGDAVGYRSIDLIYDGDLIANVGDTITSILDKIVKMLGNYEYFYDLDGHFVFQKKIAYIKTSYNNITRHEDDETYVESAKSVSQLSYNFTDANLIKSIANAPQFSNIKNDFSIWGKKNSVSGEKGKIPIHLRYAIDKKPQYYKTYDGSAEFKIEDTEWREILYQMGQDYLQHNHDDDFEVKLAHNNLDYYPTGKTGYEQYYEDIVGFWRQLYNLSPEDTDNYYLEGDNAGWNKMIVEDPASLVFWIDFLDADYSELSKYSVPAIGDRTKAINEDEIKAIYYKEVPSLIYISEQEYKEQEESGLINPGYEYVFLDDKLQKYFTISAQGKSTFDRLDELLYQHAWCNEQVTLVTAPIYYLQPNTRIGVTDEYSKISGEYIINKISIKLSYNGTMTINATRAPIELY